MPTKNSILDYAAGKFYQESQNRDTSQNVVSANQTPKIYTGLASAAAQAESAKSFAPSVDFAALREQSSQKSGAGNIPKLTQTSVGSVYPKSGSQITIEDAQKAYDEEKKKNDALNEKLSLMKQDLGDFWEQAYRPEEVQKIKDDILQSNKSLSEAEKTLNSLKTKRDADKVASDVKEIFSMPQDDSNALEDYIRGQDELSNMDAVEGRYQYLARVKELDDLIAPLEEKYGKDRVSQLLESYRRFLHEDDAQEKQDRVAQLLVSSPYEATVNNIYATVSKPFSDVAAIIGRAEELAARSGYLETLDPYTYRDMGNVYTSAVRSQTQKNIEGEDPNFVRKGLSIGYQAVNSLADNAMRLAVAGPTGATGAATLAAMGSFSQTVSDAAQRGATPEQAWALGIVNAGIEAITEKIPLDNLLTIAKGGGAKDLVKNVIRSMAIEVTEEELSLIGNVLADSAIMREKSEYNQRVAQLTEDGKTQEEAREIADRELILEALNTAAVSGISGGISGFGASKYYAYFGDRNTGLQTAQKPSGAADASAETAKNPQQAIAAGAAKDIARKAMENGSIQPQPQQTQQEVNLQNAMKATLSEEGKKSVDIGAAQKYDNNTPIGIHASIGNSGVTYTSDNQAVNFQYAIVPAESLIASNDQYGNINKAYPAELQPRDRTRAASQTQINSMSRNLNPALLAESPTAQNGAPIIRGDGVVIGGNGRVSAIVQAYGAGRGGEYQHYITSRAADLGIDPKTLPENPVLVRVANGVDNYTELAHSLNASTTAAYSATEAAKSDASRVGDIVEYLSVSDDGKINTIENKGFIQKFVSQVVPKTERGDVMQSDGKLSQAGERRILNALFYYAYGDISLVERLTESTDNNAKNIINAMLGNSAKVAKLQSEIGRGEIQDFGLRNAITKATNLYLDAKEAKVPVSEVSDQLIIGYNGPESQFDGLTVNLARFMEYNNRSAKQIRDFINILIDVNMNIASDTATEISMFDTGEKKTQEVLYDEAVTAYDKQRDGKGRIPEKSGFSQYKQYKQEDLAAVMGGSGKTGSTGQAEIHGGSVEPVPEDAPGGHWSVDHPSIGAAEQNFTGKANYQQLLSDDNAQPDRADDVRPMEIPKRDADGRNVTEFAANVYGASVTTDAMANEIESIIQDKSLSFDTRTNKQSLKDAAASIDANGEDAVRNKIAQNAAAGVVADGDIEKGLLLYAKYASDPKKQDVASGLIIDLGKLANMSGRNLQLFSLIRRMTPEGQLMTVRKNISRYVSDINKGRSAKKQIDIDGKQESVRQVSQAASEAKKNTERIMSEAGKKTSYRNGKVVVEGNQSGEPFVFEYAQKVGDALATGLERSTNPKKEKTFLQTMTSEIRRFAAEKLPKQQSRKPLTAVELLRDYIQNQEFYNQAWENAQQSLRDRNVDNPDLEEFMNSGIGVDANGNKNNKIFTKALAYSAAKSGETSAILKQQEALGFTNMSENVANYLIQETGATGEMADTIRDAASYYVNDILNADGKGGRSTDQLVESSIRSAMRDIGETISDTAKSSAETKENVKDRVVDTLVKKYGFGNADASHVADVVGEQYASMVKAQAQKILQQKFADRPERSKKTTMQIFEELGNLGAFDAGSAYNEKAATKVLGDSYGVSIDEDMANRFLNAKTDEEKIAVMDEIYKDVASRIKPTIGEMWDAWRNLAMLGNPMTHERNIFSTAAFQPFVEVKRNLGAIIEKAFVPKNQRTKSILGVDKNSRALLDFAKQDAKTRAVSDLMSYTASTGDEARSKIQDYRKILPGPLDAVAKKNMALMEGSDMFFKRGEYARSLASFLKARGYTAKQAQSGAVPKGVMEEARTYAVREAQRATFNDRNGFSDWISKLGSKNKNQGAGYAVLNIVKKGIVPFLRTPTNVVKRAAEYNPISIATTLFTAKSDIDSGKLSAADVVDRVSSGLTGSAAMGLGAALAAGVVPGIKLIGKVEDENEKREGAQDYSIKIGGRYYGIAWLAPAMIPMFIGANLYNKVNSLSMQDSVDGWDVTQSILEVGTDSMDPLLELSMLSSLNSFIDNISNEETAGDKAVAALIGAATSYFSQGLPTVFGQLEKATEKQQSSTYVNTDNKLEKAIKKTLSMASRKIPGIDLYQTEKLDEFGKPVKNAENPMFRAANAIFNPSTVTKEKSDPVTKELTRLSRATGMNVSSNSATYVLSYTDKDGNRHSDYRPTEQEYNTMAKTQGQTAYNISQSLFKTDIYKAMGDAQKAQAVSQIMAYAKENAKNTALPDAFGFEDSWMEKISSFSPKLQAQYIARRVQSNALENAVSSLVGASKNGFSTSSRLNALDSVYRDYRDMPAADRQNVYSQATGSTRIYLESRDSGVSHSAATKAILAASNAKGTGANGYVTDADRYTAIAAAGLTKSQTDLVMHAYLPDYNPEAGKTDKAELKYDYIRQEMNLSPADYAKAMSAKSGYTKKKDIIESFEKAGFTNAQANQLYKLFNGNFNVVAWYESIQK